MNKTPLYDVVRPSIQTGDAVLWQSPSIIGKLIQWGTDSKFNHVSIAIRFTQYDQDRVWILEELGDGAVLNPLSYRLATNGGHAWVFPLNPDLDALRVPMGAWALKVVGTPYDYVGLFENIAGRISSEAHRMICSGYWWKAFKEAVLKVPGPYKPYDSALIKLKGDVPRPSDFPMLKDCGIFLPEKPIL